MSTGSDAYLNEEWALDTLEKETIHEVEIASLTSARSPDPEATLEGSFSGMWVPPELGAAEGDLR